MQIKREFEMTSRTSRRFVIRQSGTDDETGFCEKCGEPMVVAEQAAKLFGVRQRQVFQTIEKGNVHFCETDAGVTLVCIASMRGEGDVEAFRLGPAT